ncbi:MAG: cytochrome c biogenesis protein CcdA [Anaerolineae bacterium]
MDVDLSIIANASVLAFVLTFLAGVVTSIGPCNAAMIPLIMAYVGGQKEISRGRSLALSVMFALGLAITLVLLGVIAALLGGIIGVVGRVWYYVVAVVFIVMGAQWLGIIYLPLPDLAATLRGKVGRRGLLGALLLGLVSGLVASGCATPALAAILTLVMSKGAILYGAGLLLVYGLGRGVPIVILGGLAGLIRARADVMRWGALLERVSGALMIVIGLYIFWIA